MPEGAEKAAEESEIIKELIIEKERDIKECPAVSNEDESVKKVSLIRNIISTISHILLYFLLFIC